MGMPFSTVKTLARKILYLLATDLVPQRSELLFNCLGEFRGTNTVGQPLFLGIGPTIATPALFGLGQFARECQVSHLVGRVVRHVFSPISDTYFHGEEARQLERTLLSFLPLLIEEEVQFSNYCGALATCVR